MILVIGLGNPGKEHMHDRHNVGFMALDAFAKKHELYFNHRKILHADIAPFGTELLLMRPDTFMNNSGIAARAGVRNYDASVAVIYDDITINVGVVKCSFGRGDGGHNGLTSIISELGTKDFFRIRIGIRPVHEELLTKILPPNGFETFMLSPFAPFETELRDASLARAIEIIEQLPHKTFEEIMNEYN